MQTEIHFEREQLRAILRTMLAAQLLKIYCADGDPLAWKNREEIIDFVSDWAGLLVREFMPVSEQDESEGEP